jgi:hypothetical protein
MKLLQLFFTAAIFSISLQAQAHRNRTADTSENTVCLEVLGIAMDANEKPIDGVQVRLFKENEELEWTDITSVMYHEHSFIFKLEANNYYTIEISKPGYVTRSVGISTQLPANVSLEEVFRYEFEVQLFKEKKNSNDYYLDFPVALISYDATKDIFMNNSAYTRHIKTMINQTTGETSTSSTQQKNQY